MPDKFLTVDDVRNLNELNIVSRKQVYEAARKYLRTPYRKKGRQIGIGVDCVGMVLCVASDLKIKDKEGNPFHPFLYMDYPDNPLGDQVQEGCVRHLLIKSIGSPSSFSQMVPGDVVSMRIPQEGLFRRTFVRHNPATAITHVGIVCGLPGGALGVIHAFNSGPRKVVEHVIDLKWLRRIAGVFSFPGVTD